MLAEKMVLAEIDGYWPNYKALAAWKADEDLYSWVRQLRCTQCNNLIALIQI
jgi:hypothetical protein